MQSDFIDPPRYHPDVPNESESGLDQHNAPWIIFQRHRCGFVSSLMRLRNACNLRCTACLCAVHWGLNQDGSAAAANTTKIGSSSGRHPDFLEHKRPSYAQEWHAPRRRTLSVYTCLALSGSPPKLNKLCAG